MQKKWRIVIFLVCIFATGALCASIGEEHSGWALGCAVGLPIIMYVTFLWKIIDVKP